MCRRTEASFSTLPLRLTWASYLASLGYAIAVRGGARECTSPKRRHGDRNWLPRGAGKGIGMSWTSRGFITLVALCALLTLLYADSPDPSGDPPKPTVADDPRISEDPRKLAFEQYPEPNGIPFEDLSAEDQAIATGIAEAVETEQGHEVSQAWSRAARSARQRAQVRRAQNAVGISDADVLGVR